MIQINFPKEGGQSAYTYSVSNCAGNKDVTFTFANSSAATWINVTSSATEVSIATTTSSENDSRVGSVNVNLNGTKCDEFKVTQAGNACNCDSVTVSETAATYDSTQIGSVTAATWSINSGCNAPQKNLSWTSTNSITNGYGWSLAFQGQAIVISGLQENDTTSDRTDTIRATFFVSTSGGQTIQCTKTIAIKQKKPGCTCTAVNFSLSKNTLEIPFSGGSDSLTFTYNTCGTVTTSHTNNEFTVTSGAGGTLTVTKNTVYTGHVTPLQDTITFTVKDGEGNDCPSHTVIVQQGVMPCSCSASSWFITSLNLSLPNEGQSTPVDIASANTYGCGALEFRCSTAIFDGYTTETVDLGNYQYLFRATGVAPNNTGAPRTGGIYIWIKWDGQSQYEPCDTVVYVKQSQGACECDKVSFNSVYDTTLQLACSARGDMSIGNVSYGGADQCFYTIVESNTNWITPHNKNQTNITSPSVDLAKNTTNATRSGVATVKVYKDCNGYVTDGGGNIIGVDGGSLCSTKNRTISQSACTPCDCTHIPQLTAYTLNFHASYSGKSSSWACSCGSYWFNQCDSASTIYTVGYASVPDGCDDGLQSLGYYVRHDNWFSVYTCSEEPGFYISTVDANPSATTRTGYFYIDIYSPEDVPGGFDPYWPPEGVTPCQTLTGSVIQDGFVCECPDPNYGWVDAWAQMAWDDTSGTATIAILNADACDVSIGLGAITETYGDWDSYSYPTITKDSTGVHITIQTTKNEGDDFRQLTIAVTSLTVNGTSCYINGKHLTFEQDSRTRCLCDSYSLQFEQYRWSSSGPEPYTPYDYDCNEQTSLYIYTDHSSKFKIGKFGSKWDQTQYTCLSLNVVLDDSTLNNYFTFTVENDGNESYLYVMLDDCPRSATPDNPLTVEGSINLMFRNYEEPCDSYTFSFDVAYDHTPISDCPCWTGSGVTLRAIRNSDPGTSGTRTCVGTAGISGPSDANLSCYSIEVTTSHETGVVVDYDSTTHEVFVTTTDVEWTLDITLKRNGVAVSGQDAHWNKNGTY